MFIQLRLKLQQSCGSERSFSTIRQERPEQCQKLLSFRLTGKIAKTIRAARNSILDAAQQVFSEKGFELATIQDVATACGMSAGNLYRYFPSKAAMVSGLVERDRDQTAASFATLALSPNQLASFETMGREFIKCGVRPPMPDFTL